MGKTIKLANETYLVNDIYRTSETKIGIWINNRPIYRKVIEYEPSSSIGSSGAIINVQIAHGISHLSQIIKAFVVDGSNFIYPILGTDSSGSSVTRGSCISRIDGSNITFRIINDSWSSRKWYFVLEYTKTTD